MENNYGNLIEKYLCAIAWHKDVTENIRHTKHLLTMTNGLIKYPQSLTPAQVENLKGNKEELEIEIEIVTQDLNADLLTKQIYN